MVPRSRSLLDGLSGTTQTQPRSPSLADRCDSLFVVNQDHDCFSFGQRLIRNRALVVHTISTVNRDETEGACEKISELRAVLSDVFTPEQISIATLTLEPNVSVTETLQPLADQFQNEGALDRSTEYRGAGECEWNFVTGTDEVLPKLREALAAFETNPYVYQNIVANTSMLVFGNATFNRWAGLPIGLSHNMLIQAIRRVCGFTYLQRYGCSEASFR